MNSHIILNGNGKILPQSDDLIRHAVQLGKHRVKAVGNIRESRGMLVIAKRHEGKVENFIRAVGAKHFVGIHPQHLGELFM